ncbi:MAG TPA: glycosyltransferase family 9 protein [Acidobacteriaceae bacterium]|nr:glycosyltransferase family 9 protein [Acidobacteriaceae bacterium]
MPANSEDPSGNLPKKLRLLIVRLGAMGDILHSMPAVTALRQAHPEWRIGWAMEPQWRGLFCTRDGRMPLVDQVHMVPAKRWAQSPLSLATLRDIRRVRGELRGAQYDIAVDMQGAVRSAMVARWSKAEHVIGEAAPRERAAKWLFHERVPTRGAHVIEQSLEVANAILRERLPMTLPLLPDDPGADAEAAQIPQPFVLMSPGAGWGAKRWPADRYGAVARRLAEAGYGVVINRAPAEEHLAEEIVATSGGAARAMTLDLSELIAVTRRAALAIAGDTGPLHLACALAKPVVGIFGPTDPARNGPYHCRSRVLRNPASVRDHSRRSEPEAGLLTITPEDVTNAALELLREVR